MGMRFTALVASLALLVGGCQTVSPLAGPGEPSAVAAMADLPPPAAADIGPISETYLISPYDKLEIKVFGADELSGEIQVDPNGDVSLGLIGAVQAVGKTPAGLGAAISERLAKFIRNPQVSVNLKESPSRTYTVDGQVREPGVYPVLGKMSLMRAIASAKGSSEFAKLENVIVFRTVDGQPMAALYNVGAIRRGVYADPRIYANDIIVVDEARSRQLFKQLLQATPGFLTPIVLLLRN